MLKRRKSLDKTIAKKPQRYFFIDESGDAAFYASGKRLLVGEKDFKPLLLMGMIELEDKASIYKYLNSFQDEIRKDPLYNSLKCVADADGWYLHAKNDQVEIRAKFVEALRKLEGYRTFVVIGRKRLKIFQTKHNSNESEFYFDMIYHLLKDRLNDENYYYQIFLANRKGNDAIKLKEAINKAIERDNQKRKTKLEIHFDCRTIPSSTTPELSIVDYMLWSLQRYILNKEARYYLALKEKYNLIIDLYDFKNFKTNYYHKNNPFELEKASEFERGGYA
jgi:hypothetical protein